MACNRSTRIKPGTHREKALHVLKGHPNGRTSDELVDVLGGDVPTWGEVLRLLCHGGAACWVADPKGKAAHRKRYFAIEFADNAAEYKRQREAKIKPKKAAVYGLRLDSAEPAVMPRGVRVTVGPSFDPDKRFLPSDGDFAPLFSCLAPGRYLDRDTWAARAYGGGR